MGKLEGGDNIVMKVIAEFSAYELIGKTKIGSHIWAMNNRWSDEDYFVIYSEPVRNILDGTATFKSDFVQLLDKSKDTHYHEISHVIDQLLVGNMNYVIGMLSPIIVERTDWFMKLRKLTRQFLSKQTFYSINGMAEGNYVKYVLKGEDASERKCNQILRAIQMGITLLQKGKVEFKPYSGGSPDEILEKLSELQFSYNISPLPDRPEEGHFRDLLVDYRLCQLIDSGLM